MADQLDARQNLEQGDVNTAVVKKTPHKVGDTIQWSETDEEIRLACYKRIEKSQQPSMWQYDPKGGVPTELANLDSSTFLTSRLGQILCFLPKDVLVRICSMLSVCDFLNLSSTCRFLHWRMFTFCTCYAPYKMNMQFIDDGITEFWVKKKIPPISLYTLYIIGKGGDSDGSNYTINRVPGDAALAGHNLSIWESERGLFLYQPFCLRKPFFFNTLELVISLPYHCKELYDRCLPYIQAVRGLALHLNIRFITQQPQRLFSNYSETNDFLMAVNASFYENFEGLAGSQMHNNVDIYMNCPYARQMHSADIINGDIHFILNMPVFQNSIGLYWGPLDTAIMATLKDFLAGSTNLIFHQYLKIENNNGRFPLIEYLFEKFGEFEEFFYVQKETDILYFDFYTWKKVVPMENGGQLRIVIQKFQHLFASVTIGKEELYDEVDKKFTKQPRYPEDNIWWKMETAGEPDEATDANVAMETTVVELDVAVKKAVAVGSDEDEEPDEVEEE